jgi:glycine cleavage system regulatory protein
MDTTDLVLTVMGEDQPGLVEALAAAIAAHDGNWLESRMAHLAGKFAGILRVSVPRRRSEELLRALAALERRGLRVAAEPGAAGGARALPVTLELVGADHPGIVRDVSTLLARRQVNVEELHTECTTAPVTGEPLFRARAALQLPPGVTVESLRRDLEGVANDLMVDLTLGAEAAAPRRRPQGA